MEVEKATGDYHFHLRGCFIKLIPTQRQTIVCCSQGQWGGSRPKHELHATTARAFKWPVMSTATSLHERGHMSSTFCTPTKPCPLVLIDPHTLSRAEPITRSHLSSATSHPPGCSAKRWARSARIHELKVLRERRGSAGGKRSGGYKDRENDHLHGGSSEDVFSAPSILSPSQVKAKGKPHGELRQPLTPLGLVWSMEEGVDADTWIDAVDNACCFGGP